MLSLARHGGRRHWWLTSSQCVLYRGRAVVQDCTELELHCDQLDWILLWWMAVNILPCNPLTALSLTEGEVNLHFKLNLLLLHSLSQLQPSLFLFLSQLRNQTTNGAFGPWAPWQPCNNEDGVDGVSSCLCRSRSCDSPAPRCGGRNCQGPTIEVSNCSRWGNTSADSFLTSEQWLSPLSNTINLWNTEDYFFNQMHSTLRNNVTFEKLEYFYIGGEKIDFIN